MSGQPLPTGLHLAWLPLVPRPRPPCLPLPERIRQLYQLATQPNTGGTATRLTQAAEVCNKAALIASDAGLPELARALCWRQQEIFQQAGPPPGTGKLALQPVLNLARQLIRDGDGQAAYRMLHVLYQAACQGHDAVIDGRTISLARLTATPTDRRTISTLLWAALLADGTRALILAGRWREAVERAMVHRGVGTRLLDGRQTTILALALSGDINQATLLVEKSTITQPWEQAIHDLLKVLCQQLSGTHAEQDTAAMVTSALTLLGRPDPNTVVFRARTALTALALTPSPQPADDLHAGLIRAAASDAHVARDVLTSSVLPTTLTNGQHHQLTRLLHASGLGTGAIPPPLSNTLMAAVEVAENELYEFLT